MNPIAGDLSGSIDTNRTEAYQKAAETILRRIELARFRRENSHEADPVATAIFNSAATGAADLPKKVSHCQEIIAAERLLFQQQREQMELEYTQFMEVTAQYASEQMQQLQAIKGESTVVSAALAKLEEEANVREINRAAADSTCQQVSDTIRGKK